jgi:hypothetical protein
MGFLIGGLPTATSTDAKFGLGDRMEDGAGKIWVYVKASAAIVLYDVVTFDETYSTVVAPVTTTNGARGDQIGVAAVAFASSDYGWLQIYGPCTMNVKASCAANVRVNTTATAGSPDDDGTSTTKTIDGIYLTAARGGTDGSAAGILNFPAVGATL